MENSEFQVVNSKNSEDPLSVRKRQKAGREKKRRDLLNEQFLQLGVALDAERPKNDKATILAETVQLLNDLTTEVDKLKAEHAALSEESCELTQEKNDVREEKMTLKSDIERLKVQYQQRLGSTFAWSAPDSALPHPHSYPYPMPIAFPSTPIPVHPSMQPYPFFNSPNPGFFPNPCSTFVPYMAPNPPAERQYACPTLQPDNRSQSPGGQAVTNTCKETEKSNEKNDDSNEVATDLELKTPGSTADEDSSPGGMRYKRNMDAEASSDSRCSSHSVQDSSSNVVFNNDNGK